jgi:adenylate cyclase
VNKSTEVNKSVLFSAWLEGIGEAPYPVAATCTLGRSGSNQVVLKDKKASRHHALIQAQGGEYWLVDFGSTNGTLVNGRRVTLPTLLRNGDQLLMGDSALTFHQIATQLHVADATIETATDFVTMREIKSVLCWLLIVDIEGSTRLSVTCPPDELPLMLGRWFSSCKETIDACAGQINKFLGDGFFAYWIDRPAGASQVAKAVLRLCEAQSSSQPSFRWVLHRGQIFVGGSTALGEENLMGPEVNFAFRMEKLASQLRLARLVSDVARQELGLERDFEKVGPHELSGFEGKHIFHTF